MAVLVKADFLVPHDSEPEAFEFRQNIVLEASAMFLYNYNPALRRSTVCDVFLVRGTKGILTTVTPLKLLFAKSSFVFQILIQM